MEMDFEQSQLFATSKFWKSPWQVGKV